MKRMLTKALACCTLALIAPAVWPAPVDGATPLHPDFALLDITGANVLDSGAAVSTMRSCGQCHDTSFIAAHAFHADLGLADFKARKDSWDASPGLFGRWDPLRYRFLTQAGDERFDLGTADWLKLVGDRVVGGGPGVMSRTGIPLAEVAAQAGDPDTNALSADGTPARWDWQASGTLEMNCFLCHLETPDAQARAAAIRAGDFANASTATLTGLGIVERTESGWAWNRAAFSDTGELRSSVVGIQDPTNANCAACHGEVHPATDDPLMVSACDLDYPQTATTGQVVASQRINESGMNLANKAALAQSWDIHAERQLQCTDCHYALNNPAHAGEARDKKLAHLRYDPRSLEINEYLKRPDHNFARGQSAQHNLAPEYKGSMRRCENCHDAAVSHRDWLPYIDKHMSAVACESCHIPQMHAPAIQTYDWTVVDAAGQPVDTCRGIDGPPGDIRSLVTGYQPVLLNRRNSDGAMLLAPYNLITTFYWVYRDAAGNRRPVRLADLKAAFLDHGAHAAPILAAFDADADGRLDRSELAIDTPVKEQAVKQRLTALGLADVRIEGRVQPYSINHGVTRGEHALSDCRACHSESSRVAQAMLLAGHAPVTPVFATDNNVAGTGQMVAAADGALYYQPLPANDRMYVFGSSRVAWIDQLGLFALAGTLFGVLGHGALRFIAARRRPQVHAATRRVRMYDAYRRFWHWLQAASIIALLLTGLVIHRPDLFAAVSFRGVVTLHNILAVILVVNAALSFFYHVATERMREYLPRFYGFFDDSILQAKYYISGIFKGEPHPFEKRPDSRMNPIQKLTYFGILNVLLPLQIASGALIWGAQRWPEAATAIGGLPFLASVHALVAWLFASFIIGHVYLTTTGPTPLEAIRGMVTGYEEVETHDDEHAQAGAGAPAGNPPDHKA